MKYSNRDGLSIIDTTPFGCYCKVCNKPLCDGENDVAQSTVMTHIRKHIGPDAYIPCKEICTRLKNKLNMMKRERNLVSYIVPNIKEKKWLCMTCNRMFTRKYTSIRHAKEKHDIIDVKEVYCRVTVCGRLIDDHEYARIIKMSRSNIKVDNRAFSIEEGDVLKVLDVYKMPDENCSVYIPMCKAFLMYHDKGLDKYMYNFNHKISQALDNPTLKVLFEIFKYWLDNHASSDVSSVGGDLRLELVKFESMSKVTDYGNYMFNMRMNKDSTFKEMQMVICFLWVMRDDETWDLPYIRGLSSMLCGYHVNFSCKKSRKQMCQKMLGDNIIWMVFRVFLIEKQESLYSIMLGQLYCFYRYFNVSRYNKKITLRSCGQNASITACFIHVLRLSVISSMKCQGSVREDLATQTNRSHLIHLLCPMICQLRKMETLIPSKNQKTIYENEDISVGRFLFKRIHYTNIIPRIMDRMDKLFGSLYEGMLWKRFTDVTMGITVEQDTTVKYPRYIFHVSCESFPVTKIIHSTLLTVKDKNNHEYPMLQLGSLVKLSLHGTGYGAMRMSELSEIDKFHLQWKDNTFYYYNCSNKKGSIKNINQKLIEHKLYCGIARRLLLYNRLCIIYGYEEENIVMGFKASQKDVNALPLQEFSEIMYLKDQCTAVAMRGMYTSLLNIVFPNSPLLAAGILSASTDAAESAGHCLGTHDKHYNCNVGLEYSFRIWHEKLGAPLQHKPYFTNRSVTVSEIENHLSCMYGDEGKFLSKEQRRLVENACNNTERHCFGGLVCGGGKTLSISLPVSLKTKLGLEPKMSIVIIPYCFLLRHIEVSIRKAIGSVSVVRILSYKKMDMTDNRLPDELSNKENLPDLLLLSLEAFSFLFDNFKAILDEWIQNNLVFKIYVDEIHTLYLEEYFRPDYKCYKHLAVLRVPIVILSGSVPPGLIGGLFRYLNFVDDPKNCYNGEVDVIYQTDIIGKPVSVTVKKCSDEYVDVASHSIHDFLANCKGGCCHVIVSTIKEGTLLSCCLEKLKIQYEYINSKSNDIEKVAKEWVEGNIPVLITTTLGLVGNECSKNNYVVCVGTLYDLMSYVQAMSRIRPKWRNENSRMDIFIPDKPRIGWVGSNNQTDDYNHLQQLKSDNLIVSAEDESIYNRCLTKQSVNDWLYTDEGCRISNLAKRMGYNKGSCTKCDVCSSSPIAKSSVIACKQITIENEITEKGKYHLKLLEYTCLSCKDTYKCVGMCYKKNNRCFKCDGMDHLAGNCPKRYQKAFAGKW